MDLFPKTLHTKSEASLAGYQSNQVGNSCTLHTISAGLRLLVNYHIDPMDLSDEVNRLWWRGRFMRLAPDWAVTPRMQVRIVRYLARTRFLPVSASFQHGNPGLLIDSLANPTTIPIITIFWLKNQAPAIYYANSTGNYNASHSIGAHSMIFAVYDPNHHSGNQVTPWGFINSWKDNGSHLFWMSDEDFLKSWGIKLPFMGYNPLVLIRRQN